VVDFRQACQTYALQQVSKQLTQFQTLGLYHNELDYVVTCSSKYTLMQMRQFQTFFEEGLIFRALKPVF
jgi:isoleucyl-tRNA synthetase